MPLGRFQIFHSFNGLGWRVIPVNTSISSWEISSFLYSNWHSNLGSKIHPLPPPPRSIKMSIFQFFHRFYCNISMMNSNRSFSRETKMFPVRYRYKTFYYTEGPRQKTLPQKPKCSKFRETEDFKFSIMLRAEDEKPHRTMKAKMSSRRFNIFFILLMTCNEKVQHGNLLSLPPSRRISNFLLS